MSPSCSRLDGQCDTLDTCVSLCVCICVSYAQGGVYCSHRGGFFFPYPAASQESS